MQIYDCFLFHNEIEVLKARILYLKSVVDYFVVAESTLTFSGKEKKCIAKEVVNSLDIDLDRVIFLQYIFPPKLLTDFRKSGNRWLLERYGRQSLYVEICKVPKESLVILSDVDEIPSRSQIKCASSTKEIVRLPTPEYYGKLNWKKSGKNVWATVKMGPASLFTDLNQIRYMKAPISPGEKGSHFSDLFKGVEDIKSKAQSSAHSEFDLQESELNPILNYAREFKIDHHGRFFRNGMGLVRIESQLSDQQRLLAEIEPRFLDTEPTPSIMKRICASYNISEAWRNNPVTVKEVEGPATFLKAVLKYFSFRTLANIRRFSEGVAQFSRRSYLSVLSNFRDNFKSKS